MATPTPGLPINIHGPTPANIAPPQAPTPPAPTPINVPTVRLFRILFEATDETLTVNYGNAAFNRSITVSASTGLVNSLVAAAQAAIETDQGWPAGSSTLV